MTDAADYGVNEMRFLLRFNANLRQYHGPSAEEAEEHIHLQTKQIQFSEV